jgi:hypothetical protein
MEYEISDEEVLFDESTNPSLKKRDRQSVHLQSPARRPARHTRKGEVLPEEGQKAEVIPEEEEQQAA